MKLMQFFASLRHLLALEYAKSAIGAVPQEAIRTLIIPNLQREAAKTKDPAMKERIEGVIAIYEKAADPNGPEADMFRNTAIGDIRAVAERFGSISEGEIDETAQEMAAAFFAKRNYITDPATGERISVPSASEWMKSFDESMFPLRRAMRGPQELNKHWSTMVYRKAMDHFRSLAIYRKHEQPLEELGGEGEEGEERSWEEFVPAKGVSPFDESILRENERQFKKFVYRQIKDPATRRMFDLFFREAKRKGADEVDMKNDILPVLQDEGFALSRSSASEKYRNLVKVFVSFFESPPSRGGLGIELTESLKKRLLLSAERVARDYMFRAFARWMLAGVPPRRYRAA